MKKDDKKCRDCLPYRANHFSNWVNGLFELVFFPLFRKFVPGGFLHYGEKAINNIFLGLGIFSLDNEFSLDKISPRTVPLVKVAMERRIKLSAIKSFGTYTNNFRLHLAEKHIDFEGLPHAGMENQKKKLTAAIDDKWIVKSKLRKNGLPVASGKAFWWFQKKKAEEFARVLGYPLVVKPRIGSLSQHVYLDIKNTDELDDAIQGAKKHSPAFIVEEFLADTKLFRITIINRSQIFIAKRSAPKVMGNGKDSVKNLTLNNAILADLAAENTIDLNYIPQKNEEVLLSKKIILALGAEIEQVKSENVHEDNLEIFKKTAAIFKTKLIGIDFLIGDITKSWRSQKSAIIEINSLPNIQMHSYKNVSGVDRNEVAEAIIDTVSGEYN